MTKEEALSIIFSCADQYKSNLADQNLLFICVNSALKVSSLEVVFTGSNFLHASFEWFVTIVAGLMVRSDCLGLTSIIRDFALMPFLYPCLEHFFLASSWEWDSIFYTWAKTVAAKAPLRRIATCLC